MTIASFNSFSRAPVSKIFVFLALLLIGLSLAKAHKVSSVSLISTFETAEGLYELDAAMEVIPSEDDALNDEISPEDAAREFATEYLTVLFDEQEVLPQMTITRQSTSDEETPAALKREQVIVKLTGSIPEGSEEFLLYLDPGCPMAVVMVVVKDDRPSRRMQVVLAGEYSRPVDVLPIEAGDPFSLPQQQENGTTANEEGEETEGITGDPINDERKGFVHFIHGVKGFFDSSLLPPLFVVCLFLLSPRRKPVLMSIAGFLFGLCLAIALRGWELIPLLSWATTASGVLLAILGLEALVHGRFCWWRVALFFIAGFATGVLLAMGEPFREVFSDASDAESFIGVIAFIFGAEVAAVAVGLVVGLLLRLLFRFDWYQKSVVQPVAVLITAYGLYHVIIGVI